MGLSAPTRRTAPTVPVHHLAAKISAWGALHETQPPAYRRGRSQSVSRSTPDRSFWASGRATLQHTLGMLSPDLALLAAWLDLFIAPPQPTLDMLSRGSSATRIHRRHGGGRRYGCSTALSHSRGGPHQAIGLQRVPF